MTTDLSAGERMENLQTSIEHVKAVTPMTKGGNMNHPPPSSVEIKERVEVYTYCPSGPSWSVVG